MQPIKTSDFQSHRGVRGCSRQTSRVHIYPVFLRDSVKIMGRLGGFFFYKYFVI